MHESDMKELSDTSYVVYLLHGDEPFLVREAVAVLRRRVLEGTIEDFNLDRFDARELGQDISNVVGACRTLPMMADRRLVWLKHAEVLFGQRGEKAADDLIEYLESPDPQAVLLLQAEEKVPKNLKLYKRLAKAGCALEFKPLREWELQAWAASRAKDTHRARMSRDAAAFLVDCIGGDLAALDSAIERLVLYAGSGSIELGHVEEAIAHTRARTVWELVDAVADRDVDKAVAHTDALLGQGEAALKLLSLLSRQFRQLIVGRSVRSRGGNPSDAAAAAGVPPFRASTFARQLEHYSGQELVGALERLAAADRQLKGSKLPDELIFFELLLDLCSSLGA